ncbi:MAG: wax ester/triacylglycerol synthase family O-acyltransferase [Halioglobus sp.]
MKQLTGQDTIYLNLEGEETTTHVTAMMVMDQSTAPGGLVTFKQILKHVENCLPDLPMLTQKLVRVPMQLDYPFLGYDEEFDLEFHVRHIALPQPGDWRQLCIQAARIHSRGLDLTKPLWEMYVIEGVNHAKAHPPGSFAVLLKIHHALVDGGAFTVLLSHLLDMSANTPKRKAKTSIQTRAPQRSEALFMSLKSASLRPIAFTRLLSQLAPRYLRSKLGASSSEQKRLPKPKTLFNGMIGKNRAVEGTEFDLREFSHIRSLVKGCTINDVVLAICGGAIRDYLSHRGDLPDTTLVAGAPVNLNPNRQDASDNDISLMQLAIQTHIADPLERLEAVYIASSKSKQDSEVLGSRNLGDLSKQIPAPLLSLATNVLYKSGLIGSMGQLFNLIITNVPGPRQPLYFCGARMNGIYGMAPLAHTLGLVISQMSYNGKMFFGITADRDSIPDPDLLVQFLNENFAQYQSLLSDASKAKKKVKRKASPRRKKNLGRKT